MSSVYHIHVPQRKRDYYSICKGDPNKSSQLFGHDCSFQAVTITYWGAKRWIKKKLKKDRKKGVETPFWDLPIKGAFIDGHSGEEGKNQEGTGGDRRGRS